MGSPPQLTILTLNVQGYGSFPGNVAAGAKRLRELSELQATPPDVWCIQEGRDDSDDVLGQLCEAFGYTKVQSSSAQWSCPAGVNLEGAIGAHIVNQIFMRRGSAWELMDRGMDVISSEHLLRESLPVRTCAWVKLKPRHRESDDGLSVFVYNLHVSGGRYEDARFLRGLARERRMQIEKINSKFKLDAGPHDVAVVVGDFNACSEYSEHGAMHKYFLAQIKGFPVVTADAVDKGLTEEIVQREFEEYMVAPFAALKEHNWTLAYDESTVGPTSMYGHLVDHMAVSDAVVCASHTERLLTTNQGYHGDEINQDTELPITDHNAVKVTFELADAFLERAWYTGRDDREDGLRPVPDSALCRGDEGIAHWVETRPTHRSGIRFWCGERMGCGRVDSDDTAWNILAEMPDSEPGTPSSMLGGPGTPLSLDRSCSDLRPSSTMAGPGSPRSLDGSASDVRSVLLDALG